MSKFKKIIINNLRLICLAIGVLASIVAIFGFTYAWYTWQSESTIISGSTGCFNVEYAAGSNISGTIFPTTAYNTDESKNTIIKMNLDAECSISGTGTINLITTIGICSNTDYTTSYACINAGETWAGTDETMLDGALKYAVYQGNVEINSGSITQDIENSYIHVLATDIPLSTTQVSYTIYIWLDSSVVTNNYVESIYNGTVKVISIQTAL